MVKVVLVVNAGVVGGHPEQIALDAADEVPVPVARRAEGRLGYRDVVRQLRRARRSHGVQVHRRSGERSSPDSSDLAAI
jgi:hypothetical protein